MADNTPNPLARELLEVQRTLGWMDLIIGNIDDAVYVVDDDSRLIFANQSFADIMEKPRVLLLGLKLNEVFCATLDQKATKEMAYSPLYNHATTGIYTWKKGHITKIFRISERRLPSTGQSVYLAQDISQEQELSNMKNVFVNLASHQLRTPMTSIMIHANMLHDMYDDGHNHEQRELSAKILKSSERMTRLINDILIITKLQNNAPELVSKEVICFGDMIGSLRREIQPSADEKGISLTITCSGTTEKFYSNTSALHEIMSNLLVNAVQYTPQAGTIDLIITAKKHETTITIADTGIGIPKDKLPLIFDQFFRADNAFAVHNIGTGLGLYLVKLLLMRIKGEIHCKSTLGKGTTFTLSIPSLAEPTKPFAKAKPGKYSVTQQA